MHTPHILPALLCCSPPLLTQRHHQHHHGSSMSGSSEPPVWLLPAVASAAAATSLYHSLLWPPLVLLALALVAASSLASVVLGRDQHSTSSSAAKPEQVLALIKQRRSVFPKDFSGACLRAACVVGGSGLPARSHRSSSSTHDALAPTRARLATQRLAPLAPRHARRRQQRHHTGCAGADAGSSSLGAHTQADGALALCRPRRRQQGSL
jgi:hypothetical protein